MIYHFHFDTWARQEEHCQCRTYFVIQPDICFIPGVTLEDNRYYEIDYCIAWGD